MITTDQGPTWCEWIAAAIDTYPMAKRRLSERSALIKRAADLMQSGNIGDCNEILAGLVAKAGATLPELPEGNVPDENISKSGPDQRQELSAARLMEKRDALVTMRDRLRQCRGDIAEAGDHEQRITIATRLTKGEVERKAALAHRLSLIRAQFNARRNWQPMR
jgi:hypothetical protein